MGERVLLTPFPAKDVPQSILPNYPLTNHIIISWLLKAPLSRCFFVNTVCICCYDCSFPACKVKMSSHTSDAVQVTVALTARVGGRGCVVGPIIISLCAWTRGTICQGHCVIILPPFLLLSSPRFSPFVSHVCVSTVVQLYLLDLA